MLPLPSRPPVVPKSWPELAELAERIAVLRAESIEIVADTREIVRRSQDLVAQIQAVREDGLDGSPRRGWV